MNWSVFMFSPLFFSTILEPRPRREKAVIKKQIKNENIFIFYVVYCVGIQYESPAIQTNSDSLHSICMSIDIVSISYTHTQIISSTQNWKLHTRILIKLQAYMAVIRCIVERGQGLFGYLFSNFENLPSWVFLSPNQPWNQSHPVRANLTSHHGA